MESAVNCFLNEINGFKENWKYINFNILSKNHDDVGIVLTAFFWLDVNEVTVNVQELGEILRFNVGSLEIEKLEPILEEINKGQFQIYNKKYCFLKSAYNNEFEYSLSNGLYMVPYGQTSHSYYRNKHRGFSSCYLQGSAENVAAIVTDNTGRSLNFLNKCFQKLDRPYAGFEDFVENEMGLYALKSIYGALVDPATSVIFSAPIPIHVTDETCLKNGEFKIVIEVDRKWDVCKTSIGIILFGIDENVERVSIELSAFSSEPVKKFNKLTCKIGAKSVSKVNLILRQTGEPVFEKEFFDYNLLSNTARSSVFKYINPLQKDCKFPRNEFEAEVGLVFHLAGFNVAYYGCYGEFNDEDIDVIAFLPNSTKILAIECTAKDPNNKEKLQKLFRRTSELRKELPRHLVLPVLATKLDKEVINKNLINEAKSDGVAVLDGKTLEKIFHEACENVSAETVFESLKETISDDNPFNIG